MEHRDLDENISHFNGLYAKRLSVLGRRSRDRWRHVEPHNTLGFFTKEIHMIQKSLLTFGFALAMSLAYSGSMAQTRCSSDGFGGTTCRDINGNTTRGTSDGFGGTTWRDSNGNTTRATSDGFGGTTLRDSNGNTTRATSDGFGGTTLRDSNGNRTRCSSDGFGGTTCR